MLHCLVEETDRFLRVVTVTSNSLHCVDPDGPEIIVPSVAADEQIGSAIRLCLQANRQVLPSFVELLIKQSALWQADRYKKLAHEYGYQSSKEMLNSIRLCMIEQDGPAIVLQPTKREGRDRWSVLSEDHWVQVFSDASNEELGKALRQILIRAK